MKKRFKVITVIAIILILGILILFCIKVDKISLIKNIRQKIAKTEEIETVNEVTTIDVTDLEDSGMIEHEHTFKTMYDENRHWEECTVCGEKNGEVEHSYESILANKDLPVCSQTNYYTKICKCGYSYIYKEPCVWDGTYFQWHDGYCHVKKCKNCKSFIYYNYYDNNGVLKYDEGSELCTYRHDGSIASCKNPSGICRKCGYTYKNNIKNIKKLIERN